MSDSELVEYITAAQKHGLSDMEIKKNLLSAGWDAHVVEENFAHAKVFSNQTPVSIPTHYPARPGVIEQNKIASPEIAPNTSPSDITKKSKKKLFLVFGVILLILLILAAFAYGYYTLILTNPAKAWAKYGKAIQNPIFTTKFNFSYADQTEASATSTLLGIGLTNASLTLSGSSFINATDSQNPQSSSTIQYTLGSGDTNFSTGLEYILLDKVFYLNIGSNPLLDMVSGAMNNGQKIEWLKIDPSETKTLSNNSADEAKLYQQFASPDFKNQIQQIWANSSIIKANKFLGIQKINGVLTLHFQNSVDKDALKGLVSQYAQLLGKALQGQSQQTNQSQINYASQMADQLIDKLNVQDLETWIGLFDSKLYQVHLVTNAPSFISLIQNSSSINIAQPNDAKRLADIRQMASALELYYNDNNGYPDAQNGKPVGLSPTYIGMIPEAPPADGSCTDYFNRYWYTPEGTKTEVKGQSVYSSYQLTFCLGSSVGGYQAGIGKLTQTGIQGNIACPSSNPQNCSNGEDATSQSTEAQQQISDFVSKLSFGAQITADADYSDYGKIQNLTAPSNSFDILNALVSEQNKSQDATRIANVRQLASALELYYNDKNSYPSSLQQLVPTYIGTVPTAPAPGGSCTEGQNTYSYKLISTKNYQLSFCLGSDTGGYNAGAHILSPSGISNTSTPVGGALQ